MTRLAALPLLLLLLATPAQAGLEVGADVGLAARLSMRSPPPGVMGGLLVAWRFGETHALGLGVRTFLTSRRLPAPRLQYAFDWAMGGLHATLPVSLGVSPDVYCAGASCRLAAEARAGFGLQVFDYFRAPWVSLELATLLDVSQTRRTLMVGLHVSMRWEPLAEDLE